MKACLTQRQASLKLLFLRERLSAQQVIRHINQHSTSLKL